MTHSRVCDTEPCVSVFPRTAILVGGMMDSYRQWLLLAACVVAAGGATHAAFAAGTGPARPAVRQRVALPDSATDEFDAVVLAVLAMRTRVPASQGRLGPGMQRLLREKLSRDAGGPASAASGACEALLPDGGRLPIAVGPATPACSLCAQDASAMLVDAAIASAAALTRGAGGPRLELRELAWEGSVRTNVVGVRPSEYLAGRRQEANPEYERLKLDLLLALAEQQRAEADNREDEGWLSLLSLLLTEGRVNDLRKELEREPPYTYAPVHLPYTLESTEARSVTRVTALLVMSDSLTGWSASLPVAGACERITTGQRGARSGDRNGYSDVDAAARLPSGREMFALAFDDLRARAAAAVAGLAGQAALHRAVRANRRARGGEALGWLLLARDCGVEPPPSSGWESALARVTALPYARMGSVRLPPFRLEPR